MYFLDIELVRVVVRGMQAAYLTRSTARPEPPKCLYEINNGLCDDFARDVEARLRALAPASLDMDDVLVTLEPECLQRAIPGTDTLEWDSELLDRVWGERCPVGGSWDALSPADFSSHVWLAVKTGPRAWLHFDAECPEGVPSFLQLPLFRRCVTNSWPTRELVYAANPMHVF